MQNDEKIISNKRKSVFFLREKNRMEILEDSIFMKSSEMIRKALFVYNFLLYNLEKNSILCLEKENMFRKKYILIEKISHKRT